MASCSKDGNDGTVDTARQTANDLLVADLLFDLVELHLVEGFHGPVARTAGDLVGEIVQQFRADGGVGDFGMELHGVEFAGFIGDGGKGALSDVAVT